MGFRRLLPPVLAVLLGLAPSVHGGDLGPRLARVLQSRLASAPGETATEVPVMVLGSASVHELERLGLRWHTRSGAVTTGRASAGTVAALAAHPGVEYISLPVPLEPSLDRSVEAVGASGLRGRLGGDWVGHTGAGVLVGIIDSGIDVFHEDFRDAEGNSRILFLWDQAGDDNPPPAEITNGYGSEWTAWEIQNGLALHADFLGHGTHVAGIAAGDGSATGNGRPPYRFVGLAPEAGLVVVAAELRADRIADALEYLRQKAETLGMPLVVNMSLNTVSGPRNGTAPLSQAATAFAGPGRLVAVSAGNSGGDSTHAAGVPAVDAPCTLSVRVTYPEASPVLDTTQAFELELYYPAEDSVAILLLSPGGLAIGPVAWGETLPRTITAEGTVSVYHGNCYDPSLRHILVEAGSFFVDGEPGPAPAPGEWSMVISALRPGGSVHGWVARRFPMEVRWVRGHEAAYELGAPATARSVMAVGSFNSKTCWDGLEGLECSSLEGPGTVVGEASWFSSAGPTLDGRLKPEVAAPGFAVMSSFSGTMLLPVRELWGVPRTLSDDGVHVMQAGTSMSSPHVAGALALLLAQDPEISPQEARDRLVIGGPAWDPVLGYGALNVPGLLQAEPLDLPPPPRWRAAPNPFTQATRLSVWGAEGGEAAVYDLAGRMVRRLSLARGAHEAATATWDGRQENGAEAAAGVYWVRVLDQDGRGVLKLVKLPR